MLLHTKHPPRAPHPFPTRRSSDLVTVDAGSIGIALNEAQRRTIRDVVVTHPHMDHIASQSEDRKSTRLNSSHRCISYAVFSLKKTMTGDRLPRFDMRL